MSDFTSVAQSRARYYCKGAPVQFVQVELLRIEETGQLVVTLMFKNIAAQPLTSFKTHFRCKNTQGEVIMEDDFHYTGIRVEEGASFGSDDAVYVSNVPLSSVEVSPISVQYGQAAPVHALTHCQPVPLPALAPMPAPAAEYVNRVLQQTNIAWMPAAVEHGWQCGCGAFNYNAGMGAGRCTECGAGKTALLTAVRAGMQSSAAPQERMPMEVSFETSEKVYMQGEPETTNLQEAFDDYAYGQTDNAQALSDIAERTYQSVSTALEDTASYEPPNVYERAAARAGDALFDEAPTAVVSARQVRAGAEGAIPRPSIMSKEVSKFILSFLPYITAGAALLYVLLALLIHWLVG